MLQVQRLVQKCLLKNDMKVTCTTSRVGDHCDNAWVLHHMKQSMGRSILERFAHLVKLSRVLLELKTSRKAQQSGCLFFFLVKLQTTCIFLDVVRV